MTVSKGGKFTTIYVGYGLKKGASSYNPVEPPVVQVDPNEEMEMFEPHEPKEEAPKGEESEGQE